MPFFHRKSPVLRYTLTSFASIFGCLGIMLPTADAQVPQDDDPITWDVARLTNSAVDSPKRSEREIKLREAWLRGDLIAPRETARRTLTFDLPYFPGGSGTFAPNMTEQNFKVINDSIGVTITEMNGSLIAVAREGLYFRHQENLPFQLHQMGIDFPYTNGSLTFVGTKSDDTTVTVTVVPGDVPAGNNYAFPASFDDLVKVEITEKAVNSAWLDNFDLTVDGQETPNPPAPAAPLIYDIDFSAPVHQLDETISISGPYAPRTINMGNPIVRSAVGSMTDQPMEMKLGDGGFYTSSNYEQVRLRLEREAAAYRVEMDFMIQQQGPDQYSDHFTIVFDNPQVQNFTIQENRIRLYQPGSFSGQIGTINFGQAYRVRFEIDQVNNQWEVYLDDSLIHSGPFNAGDGDIRTMRIHFSDSSAGSALAAVDNIKVWAFEPGSTDPIEPDIGIVPGSINFSNVQTGLSATRTVRITNDGLANLDVNSITLNHPAFSFVSQPTTPLQIAPGDSRDLFVRFSPTSASTVSGTLTVTSNDPDEATRQISLTGTGTAPQAIEISTDTVTLGVEPDQSGTASFSITNNGSSSLSWSLASQGGTTSSLGTVTPDDPKLSSLWGLKDPAVFGAGMAASEAWKITTGSPGVTVGVIDTGVDWDHPDLAANIWTNPGEIADNGVDDDSNGFIDDVHGWDFYHDDNNPNDLHGHGTHVSGTIAAAGDNGTGVVGVSWKSKIVPIRFLGPSGYTSDAIQSVDYATTVGVDLTNNSWGGGGYSGLLRAAINRSGQSGALFVAAAGNDSRNTDVTPGYPAAYDSSNIVSVASTDRYDHLSYFSNYGASSVDLGAPGSSIYSSVHNGSYSTKSGTSMASPHVAGAAALLLSQNGSLTHPQLKQQLLDHADGISSLNGKVASNGRLNIFKSLGGAPPEAAWLTLGTESGILSGGGSTTIQLNFDSTGLEPGQYTEIIRLDSNDPVKPVIEIRVVFDVLAASASSNDDVTEVEIPWKPTEAIANPTANLVYVVNETDGDLVAISTASNTVTAHKRFDHSTLGALISLPLNSSELFVFLPTANKFYALDPITLTQNSVVDFDYGIGSFVIANDGYLYSSHSGDRSQIKVDKATGTVVTRILIGEYASRPDFHLTSDGLGFYTHSLNFSSSRSTVDKFATTAGAPMLDGEAFDDANYGIELSIDDANDRIYRASTGIHGVEAWNIAAESTETWLFGSAATQCVSVTQLPGDTSVWGASGSFHHGIIAEFSKQSGMKIREIGIAAFNSDTESGVLMPGLLEITANAKPLYGKDYSTGDPNIGIDGHRYYIGFVDSLSADLSYSPSSDVPFAPFELTATDNEHAYRVDVTWQPSIRATGYRVYRNTTADYNTATEVAVVGEVTNFSDENVTVVLTYHYWVRAENTSGLSAPGLPVTGAPLQLPAHPLTTSATDGILSDQINVSAYFGQDADSVHIYRSASDDFSSATEIVHTSASSYEDLAVVQGSLYYYWAQAENAAGLGPLSASDSGYAGDLNPPQNAPQSVSASNGIAPTHVYIGWQYLFGARSYDILRHTTNDSSQATVIGNTTDNGFEDQTAEVLVNYYYWVRGVNLAGSGPISSSDIGWRAELEAPATPNGIYAWDGVEIGRIRFSWSQSNWTDTYQVYRSTSDDFNTANQIGSSQDTFFYDLSFTTGTIYYYWVIAENSAGSSPPSISDSGFATAAPPDGAPTSLSASDGNHENRVVVTWAPVQHATSYEIYRNTAKNSDSATLLDSVATTNYDDLSAIPEQVYHYWVKAKNFTDTSGFSTSDSGYTVLGQPQNVYATRDLFHTMVRITWNSVPDAVRYRIHRQSTTFNAPPPAEIGTVSAPTLRFEDVSAAPGLDYLYWVQAELAGGQQSQLDDFDQGRRAQVSGAGSGYAAIDAPRDVDFDVTRNRAYVTSGKGIVEVYDLAQQDILNAEWNTDGGLIGADLTPGDQLLVLAQTKFSPTGNGQVTTIAPGTGAMQTFEFVLKEHETSSYDVVALNGDKALITTGFFGLGAVPLRSLDLATGVFTILDPLNSGDGSYYEIRQQSMLSRTPDRSLVAVQESNSGAGSFFSHTPSSGNFSAISNTGDYQRRGSVDPNGTALAMIDYPDLVVHSLADGSLMQTFEDLKSGVLFDPIRPRLYAVDVDEDLIRVFDTDNWEENFTIDIGMDLDYRSSKYQAGHLAMDPSGSWLALTLNKGVKFFDMSAYATVPPSAPTSVTATDNTTADGISITWSTSPVTSSYSVLRSSTDDPGTATVIASGITTPTFLDSGIDAGSIYYYWVQSSNSAGSGPLSPSDVGERRVSAPENFTASDATHLDKIVLQWSAATSATAYHLYRSLNDNPTTSTLLVGDLTATSFDDATAEFGSTYYYWVVAENASGLSEFSAGDSGLRRLPAPSAPQLDLDSSASVGLTWTATVGATSYRIYRGSTSNPAAATQIGQTTSLTFDDTTAAIGQTSYWFLQAVNGANVSELSPVPSSGNRIFSPPTNFSATTMLRDRVYLTWNMVPGLVNEYELYRSTVDDVAMASPIATAVNTSASDGSAPSGAPLYYWIRAKNSTTLGEWSASVMGFRRIANLSEFTADFGLTGADAEPTADPDDDEFTNFEEWAQGGSNPTDSSSRPPLIPIVQNVAGSDYLSVAYLRFFGGSDNGGTYQHDWAHYSTYGVIDLDTAAWDQPPVLAPAPLGLNPAPDGYEWGCTRLPVSTDGASHGFMKLEVSEP